MSRVGKAPITLPKGVTIQLNGQLIAVKGPKGEMKRTLRPEVKVELVDGTLVFERVEDTQQGRAFHGMERALVNSMVEGVSAGFEKILDLIGVGYKADVKGKTVVLGLGYSHDIEFPVPAGVTASLLKEGREVAVKLESCDKQLLGQVAAQIRSLRPPEPYKGKGVRYSDEKVALKETKKK